MELGPGHSKKTIFAVMDKIRKISGPAVIIDGIPGNSKCPSDGVPGANGEDVISRCIFNYSLL